MCQRTTHSQSLFCVIPPHMLRSIAHHGKAQQRGKALKALSIDNTLRGLRDTLLETAPQVPQETRLIGPLGQKQRSIFDGNNAETLPGEMIRSEGSPDTGDPYVDEAYAQLGATFDFYWGAYTRNSIDDQGVPLLATVHFSTDYPNAFWNGQRIVFGDGGDPFFNRITGLLDLVGHELTHGVTQDEAQLRYFGEIGALNESISDVFGSLMKQRALNQTADQADWLIGSGFFTANVNGVAIRSLKAPGTAYDDPVLGKDPQPSHMDNFVQTAEDNGGVHINSGIPNHAFYLIATQLGGKAWERAGQIWYETLRDDKVGPTTGFRGFAGRTLANAGQLFGRQSAELKAVRNGWAQVGIII